MAKLRQIWSDCNKPTFGISTFSSADIKYTNWTNPCLFFKKMGQPRPLFCLFSFFSITILQKNCRPQRDSNSDRRRGRRARWPLDHHHGPISSLFVYFRLLTFSKCSWIYWIDSDKIIEVDLGIPTRGCRMEGADECTGLWALACSSY